MVQFFDSIPPSLLPWLHEQKIFWVASAPLTGNGHVNVSPKGFEGTFHVVDEHRVWYEDLTGSGVETISHIRENGRLTIMFVAFEGPPRIMRLYGKGTVHELGTAEYEKFIPPEKLQVGSRAVIVLDVHKVSTSCGYSIPFFEFSGDRMTLHNYFSKREEDENAGKTGIRDYWRQKNVKSLDGLLGLCAAPNSTNSLEHEKVIPRKKNKETGVSRDLIFGFGLGVVAACSVISVLKLRL